MAHRCLCCGVLTDALDHPSGDYLRRHLERRERQQEGTATAGTMVAVESKQVVDPETSGNVTRHAVMGGRGSPHLPAVVDQFTRFQSEKAA